MLILKLGGAAITDKVTPNTARLDVIAQIAGLLAAYSQPMVLVHGAGSFGHILAQEHALHLGYQNEAQRLALVQLQLQLHDLNRYVIEGLCAAGLPAMTVHPASMCLLEKGRIAAFFIEPIQRMLEMGVLPVLYGDCVWDRGQGFGIISGDQLVVYLANELKADRVAFGTNVDGVLDGSGRAIPRLDYAAQIIDAHADPRRVDVTGGIQGKLAEIRRIRDPKVHTWIFNLQKLDQLEAVLKGEGAGTLITADEG